MKFFVTQEEIENGEETAHDAIMKNEMRRELEEHYEDHDCKAQNDPNGHCQVCADWDEYQKEKERLEEEGLTLVDEIEKYD